MRDPLTEFVQQALNQGLSREQITQALDRAGWSSEEIQAGLAGFVDAGIALPVPRKRASTSPREAFLFLLLFCTLYTWMFALGSVGFDLLNMHFLQPGELAIRWISSLRAGLASVLVAFPLFLFLDHLTIREALRNPGQRISPIRRWLTYLTLFTAAAAVVSDLITLLLTFLEGEVTTRFFLKVLVVALLAGSAFIHYLRGLKLDERDPSSPARPFRVQARLLLGGVVAGVMGMALWNAGSPLKARLYRQDNQRTRALEAIERSLQSYIQTKGELPADLTACDTGSDSYLSEKTDPVTGEPYHYRVLDDTHAKVGATFALSSAPGGDDGFWKHGSGSVTFRIEVRKNP